LGQRPGQSFGFEIIAETGHIFERFYLCGGRRHIVFARIRTHLKYLPFGTVTEVRHTAGAADLLRFI
jgi:hypothetical protein